MRIKTFRLSILKPSARLLSLPLLLGLVLSAPVGALELPMAPNGYSWQECPDIKGALLVPEGWHFKRLEDKEEGKLSYFVTPKKWQPPQQVTHGLTFNILRDVPGGSARSFAQRYVAEMAASTGSQQTWNTNTGSFTGHGIIYSDGASQIFNLVLANEKTGTAFLVTFESPLEQWTKAWEEVQPVIRQLMIDDTV